MSCVSPSGGFPRGARAQHGALTVTARAARQIDSCWFNASSRPSRLTTPRESAVPLRVTRRRRSDPPSGNLRASPPEMHPVVGGHPRIRDALHTATETDPSPEQTIGTRLLRWSPLGSSCSAHGRSTDRQTEIFGLSARRCPVRTAGSRHLGSHRRKHVIGGRVEQVQWERPIG